MSLAALAMDLCFLRIGGLDIDADGCASDRAHVVFVARWSCPN